MEISDYIKELDLFKDYISNVRIPYLSHVEFQNLFLPRLKDEYPKDSKIPVIELKYYNRNFPSVGKEFKCWIFRGQIPSFEDYKDGRDMSYFGTIIS
jgi:hypothetical protein